MNWNDEGIVLSVKPHGETSVLLEMMTALHGRHFGYVRGGRSRNKQPILQVGNLLNLEWSARLSEQLGTYIIEPIHLRTDRFLTSRLALCGLNYMTHLLRLLPERDPHTELYHSLDVIIDSLHDLALAAPLIVRFELLMLQELGFGLDLSACALTGKLDNLTHVSPKTGRAVSGEAAKQWENRLLPLPLFCSVPAPLPSQIALKQGFSLTEYFLTRNIYEPRGLPYPTSRAQLIGLLFQ